MRGFSTAIVLIAALIAYGAYLRPTETQLAFVRARFATAQGELATVLGRAVIEPRLRRERGENAKRLNKLAPESPSQSETQFVTEATVLARRTGTHITQIVSKGATLPVGQLTAARRTTAPRPSAAAPVAISVSNVRGVRLPRTLTVEGSFSNLLRFLDGLGALRPLVRVNNAGLAQTDRLRATIDLDLVVLDAGQVREALR